MTSSGIQRYVGKRFDNMILAKQQEIKKTTGKEMSYKDITDNIVFMPPIIAVPGEGGKKRKGMDFSNLGLFR